MRSIAALTCSLFLSLYAVTAAADIKAATPDGLTLAYSHKVEAAPSKLFAAFSSVDKWWNGEHTYSQSAANLSLKVEAGGCFCERWPGGSVEHGRVLLVLKDELLRLDAPLGPLQDRGVTAILTFQIKPAGAASQLTVNYKIAGNTTSALDKDSAGIDAVIAGQLIRLKRYVETGNPAPAKTAPAPAKK